MKKCTKCDSEQPDGAVFCTNCGASLDDAPVVEEGPKEETAPSAEPDPVVSEPAPEPVAPVAPVPAAYPEEKKSSHAGLIAVVIIAILFGIGGIVAAVIFGINSSNNGKDGKNPSNPLVEVVETPPEIEGTKLEIGGGYVVTVPDDYAYFYDDDDDLVVGDEKGEEWGIIFWYDDSATYAQLSNKIEVLAEKYREKFSEVSYGDTTVDGMEMYYIDILIDDGVYHTVAFTKASDSKLFSAEVADASGDINHDLLDYVAEILKTAEKQTTVGSRGLESSFIGGIKSDKIDLSGLGE